MLKLGIIEVGESDYMSPMILVEIAGKEPRPCIDYRKLNGIIRTEYFPLPNIEERVEKVSAAKFITVFDLSKGYWQIPLSKTAQRYAAFCTSFGTYRPLRMSFGLKNAPYFFSKLMAELLNGLEDFVVPYLDDIAIFSDTWESHIKHMESVLQRIKRAKLTIKPSKCIAGYYQKYINLFSVIAAPLTDALKGRAKKGEIKWTTECENAFRELKGKLIDKPVLYAPNFEREFIVQTDASNAGMGAVLTQLTEQGEEHPILYLIMTDHNPLVWLNRNVSSNPRLMRWALALQPYNFRIVHRSGTSPDKTNDHDTLTMVFSSDPGTWPALLSDVYRCRLVKEGPPKPLAEYNFSHDRLEIKWAEIDRSGKEQEIKGAETDRGCKRTRDYRRMIRREMVRERGYKGSESAREKRLDFEGAVGILKPLSTTRWESRIEAIKPLRYQLGGIYEALFSVYNNAEIDNSIRDEASGLLNSVKQFKVLCYITI
ncbi:retrovirus-related Pol polyprotein from transposon 17.6 [Trichonephila clavipes]|nr:retrovirus-related Pol polyprotein from transposon 17.6 [Trichonephila clavipes]